MIHTLACLLITSLTIARAAPATQRVFFDRKNAPAQMPTLQAGESALTRSRFDCHKTGDRLELDDAVDQGIDRVIFANPDVVANPELGPALPDDDGAGPDQLPVRPLHAEPLRAAVATISRTTDTFFVCHC